MSINNILKTNLQPIWHCKKISETTWDKPKKYMVNVALNNSIGVVQIKGLNIPQTLDIVCTNAISNKFSIGDRFYYNKPLPKVHNDLQNDKTSANFEMQEYPSKSINTSKISLRYLKGR